MVLSKERESELLEKNMVKIYRAVDNFMAKRGANVVTKIPYEDFVQEVSVMFLEYIRKCETEEEINRFPWYDAKNVMAKYVMSSQPISVPIRTVAFTSTLKSIPFTVPYEVFASGDFDVDGMSKHWVQDKDTEMDFDLFMSSQDESVQRIASMRMYGMNMRDIADQFGVCLRTINKKILKLKENYDEFDKGDEDDD